MSRANSVKPANDAELLRATKDMYEATLIFFVDLVLELNPTVLTSSPSTAQRRQRFMLS
jgi:hypothetical protein